MLPSDYKLRCVELNELLLLLLSMINAGECSGTPLEAMKGIEKAFA